MDLSRDDILNLLDELISNLRVKKIKGTITIYGGSAVSYYLEERGVTRDIDSVAEPLGDIRECVNDIAQRHVGLQDDWLNVAVKSVLPPKPDDAPDVYYQDDDLTIRIASKSYLLAMKAASPRRAERDKRDAALLFNALGLNSWLDIDKAVAKYYYPGNWGPQELFWEDIADTAFKIRSASNSLG
jgi:hypothetical protein